MSAEAETVQGEGAKQTHRRKETPSKSLVFLS